MGGVINVITKGKFSSMVSLGYDRTDGLQDHFDFKQSSVYAKVRANNPEATDVYHQNVTGGEASLTLSNLSKEHHGIFALRHLATGAPGWRADAEWWIENGQQR